LANRTQKEIRATIERLETEGLLASYQKRGYRLLKLTEKGQKWLDAPPEPQTKMAPPPAFSDAADLGHFDPALFERLRAWRLQTAQEAGKPPYVVFHDRTLKEIAARHPSNDAELLDIKGVGPHKLETYGKAVLAIVAGEAPDRMPEAEKNQKGEG
jgi:ATP-dependent DNA helicase RecQ